MAGALRCLIEVRGDKRRRQALEPRVCVKKGLALLREAGYKFTCADMLCNVF